MMKIAVCDDEKIYIDKVGEIVNKVFEDCEIYGYSDGDKLLEDIKNKSLNFDMFILDIEMPNINGMEVAKKLREQFLSEVIIFLTDYEKYVFDAFEINAFRYITKSKTDSKLEDAILAAKEYIYRFNTASYIFVGDRKGKQRVNCKNIVALEKVLNLKYVNIKMKDGNCLKVRSTLIDMLREINNENFLLVKKGVAINIEHIDFINGLKLTMDEGSEYYISRDNLKSVKEKIMDYWGYV